MGLRGPQPRPESERFAEKVAPGAGGCIEWRAGTNSIGYGVFHPYVLAGHAKVYAHRWAYEQRHGPIPEGLHLDHLCRNTLCVNPDHLEPVPPAVNILRGVSGPARNARKTECHQGHPLTGSNLYITPSTGYRSCRECARVREQKRDRSRRKAS